jgi:hypothetical protein
MPSRAAIPRYDGRYQSYRFQLLGVFEDRSPFGCLV